jgi:hypothetical protein
MLRYNEELNHPLRLVGKPSTAVFMRVACTSQNRETVISIIQNWTALVPCLLLFRANEELMLALSSLILNNG